MCFHGVHRFCTNSFNAATHWNSSLFSPHCLLLPQAQAVGYHGDELGICGFSFNIWNGVTEEFLQCFDGIYCFVHRHHSDAFIGFVLMISTIKKCVKRHAYKLWKNAHHILNSVTYFSFQFMQLGYTLAEIHPIEFCEKEALYTCWTHSKAIAYSLWRAEAKRSKLFLFNERSEVKEKYPSGRSEATHKTELQAPPRSGGYRGKECIVV